MVNTKKGAREVRFMEIVYENGSRYLHYLCHKCQKYHTIPTKSRGVPSPPYLRRMMRQCEELIIWCGVGKEPKYRIEDSDGLTVRLMMTASEHKPLSKQIRKRLKQANETRQNIGRTVEKIQEGRSVVQLIENEESRVEQKILSLQRALEVLAKHKEELKEM